MVGQSTMDQDGVCTFPKLESINCRALLEPILCRDWKQLLAGSANKTKRFRISTLSALHVLEPLNCRKYKLEAKPAESAKRRVTASPRRIMCPKTLQEK